MAWNVDSACVAYRDTDGVKQFSRQPADVVEPVSFAQVTGSGKVKIRLADLVKVGPEGYIHGYICVRPPCGQYHEATFNSSKGTVEHDGERIGKMYKNADGTYSMSHAGFGGRDKLTAKYATRADAAKSIALYHNLWAMQNNSQGGRDLGTARPMAAAIVAMRAGDHAKAAEWLDVATKEWGQKGNHTFSTHAAELAKAIRDAPPSVVEVKPPKAADALEGEAARRALHDLVMTPTSSYQAELFAKQAERALSMFTPGDTELAIIHLNTAASAARRSGDTEFADKADGLARRLKGEPEVPPDTPESLGKKFRDRATALYNGARYSLAKVRIEAAQAALDAADYEGAAGRLDEAADFSAGADDTKTEDAARKLAADLRAAPQPTPIAKVDFDGHIREVTGILDDPKLHGFSAGHIKTQLDQTLDALKREDVGSALRTFDFAESSARYVKLDDIADRIHAESESLRDDDRAVQAAIVSAMPPGWKKDLRADPKYLVPETGFRVQAVGKDGNALSLHPTAEAANIPRYFTSARDVDDFVRDNKSAYLYDPYWSIHGKKKPTSTAKVDYFRVKPVKNGEVTAYSSSETRYPGEIVNYGDPDSGDPVLRMPIRFAPRVLPAGSEMWAHEPDPEPPDEKAVHDRVSGEVRWQLHHQDKLVPSVVRNTQVTVTNAPKKTKRSSTLADYHSDMYNPPFHGDTRLTPGIFSAVNEKQADAVLANGVKSGWWVPADVKWSLADNVMAHELGHGVAAKAWGNGDVPQSDSFWSDFASAAGLRSAPVRINGKITRDQVDRWISRNKVALRKPVSEYGTTNAAEMMAELWAEYSLSSTPREAAKLYGELAMARIKELEEQAAV
jgi:hypothetical protein